MEWKVPLSDVDIAEAEIQAVEQVLRSGWLSMGEMTSHFESQMAEYLKVKHAIAVSNGTTALHLAYEALGLGTEDEVILPSLTFVATANAVIYTGATPVFVDISSLDDPTISPVQIDARVNARTRAIVVMHYAGYPCQMDRILELAKKHHLVVVEDAAHAPGMRWHGRLAGGLGTLGCLSFFANKNMTTGEGGMVTTDRDDLAAIVRLKRSHGMSTLTWDRHHGHAFSYDVVDVGYNYRLDELRAALGSVQLAKLEKNNELRRQITQKYRKALQGVEGLRLPFQAERFLADDFTPACHLFPVLLEPEIDRTQVINKLRDAGVQTSLHYPPLHLFQYYRQKFGYQQGELPQTEEYSRRSLTLPLFPGMTGEQIEMVVSALNRALKEAS